MKKLEKMIMDLIRDEISIRMDKVYDTHEMPEDLEPGLISVKNDLIAETQPRSWHTFILREWRVQMINHWLDQSFPEELSDEQIKELFEHMYGKEEF